MLGDPHRSAALGRLRVPLNVWHFQSAPVLKHLRLRHPETRLTNLHTLANNVPNLRRVGLFSGWLSGRDGEVTGGREWGHGTRALPTLRQRNINLCTFHLPAGRLSVLAWSSVCLGGVGGIATLWPQEQQQTHQHGHPHHHK